MGFGQVAQQRHFHCTRALSTKRSAVWFTKGTTFFVGNRCESRNTASSGHLNTRHMSSSRRQSRRPCDLKLHGLRLAMCHTHLAARLRLSICLSLIQQSLFVHRIPSHHRISSLPLALGDVISALSSGEKFIPYRNNKVRQTIGNSTNYAEQLL